jgi:hypothetical protein
VGTSRQRFQAVGHKGLSERKNAGSIFPSLDTCGSFFEQLRVQLFGLLSLVKSYLPVLAKSRQERLLRLAWQFTRTLGPGFVDTTADALKRLKAAPERRGSGLRDEVTTSAQFDSTCS